MCRDAGKGEPRISNRGIYRGDSPRAGSGRNTGNGGGKCRSNGIGTRGNRSIGNGSIGNGIVQ